jgi:hypothetical protein
VTITSPSTLPLYATSLGVICIDLYLTNLYEQANPKKETGRKSGLQFQYYNKLPFLIVDETTTYLH